MKMNLPQVDPITQAIESLITQLRVLDVESVPLAQAYGRVLADDVVADRDSPALDVSAMDGYAVRRREITDQSMQVAATTPAGSPPSTLPENQAVQIFTGAGVPTGADCVVKREDTTESAGYVRFNIATSDIAEGQNIRRQGENTKQGERVLAKGITLGAPEMATLASFGGPEVRLTRRLKLSVLNTGDELAQMGAPVERWQIRDSNGPTLTALLCRHSWIDVQQRRQVDDRLDAVIASLRNALSESDAIILTGGVSMGDTDYVPEAIKRIGGEIAFHRLPLRPGRPVLGASFEGKPIIGLPGNPVSVAVTARVIALPILRYCAGSTEREPILSASLSNPDTKAINLTWFRLVKATESGVDLVSSRGSGDVVSLGASNGFIRFPPGASGAGPWPLYLW